MIYFRWLLALLTVGYACMTVFVLGMNVLFKLGKLTDIPPQEQRYVPLMEATPWWHLALWAMVVGLYLTAAWRLARGGRAMMVLVGAVLLDLASMVMMHGQPLYRQTFTPAEMMLDYYVAAALALVALAVWWTERAQAARA